MSATTIDLNERVSAFADAVRRHLDDLPIDQLDELTEGLEADLAASAADATDASREFDPADALAYASELRAAAGLPPRSANARRVSVVDAVKEFTSTTANRIRASKFGAGLIDFLIALRPVWWVLRGWVLFVVVTSLASGRFEYLLLNPLAFVLLLLFVVVSVQWGRGRWLPTAWLRATRTVVSVFAIIALAYLGLGAVVIASMPSSSSDPGVNYGLRLDDEPVQNIFAYDAAGQPLDFVQLYDGRGEPLTTVGRSADMWAHYLSDGSRLVPPESEAGSTAWNVFPLFSLSAEYGLGEGKATLPQRPFEQARPLVGAESLVQTCEVPTEPENATE